MRESQGNNGIKPDLGLHTKVTFPHATAAPSDTTSDALSLKAQPAFTTFACNSLYFHPLAIGRRRCEL